MQSVPCYRCNRYHRIVSLDNMLSHHKGIVLKSSRPSLPLKEAPPLISVFSPQGRRGKPPSGARNRYALRLADHQRPAPNCAGWDRLAKGEDRMCWSYYGLL